MDQLRRTPLSQDAVLVTTLVGTALPFALSADDEAERWLRVMRLHGSVGMALQGLGVGEAPLMTGSHPAMDQPPGRPALGPEVVERVARRARELARARAATSAGTLDVLFAVLEAYGKLFDRALYLRGTSRDELLERLAPVAGPASNGG